MVVAYSAIQPFGCPLLDSETGDARTKSYMLYGNNTRTKPYRGHTDEQITTTGKKNQQQFNLEVKYVICSDIVSHAATVVQGCHCISTMGALG
jgi:hypothetical protein